MKEILCSCICAKVGLAFITWLCHAPWTPTMQSELKAEGCPAKYERAFIGAAESCESPITRICSGWRAIYQGENPIPVDWRWETNGKLTRCEEVSKE